MPRRTKPTRGQAPTRPCKANTLKSEAPASARVLRPKTGAAPRDLARRQAAQEVPLLVEQRLDLGVIDIGLVVPIEAGIDELGLRFTLDCLHGGGNNLLANSNGVLGD